MLSRTFASLPHRRRRWERSLFAGVISFAAIATVAALVVVSLPTPAGDVRPGQSAVAAIPTASALPPTAEPQTSERTSEPGLTPAPSETAAATPATALEQSDLFWKSITGGEWTNRFDSLAEMAADADLIVVGRIADIVSGDMVRGWPVTHLTIAIDEVIRGEPQTRTPGTFTLQALPANDEDAIVANRPDHQSLLFLWYAPARLERLGQPVEEQNDELYEYILINGGQGLIRGIDDVVRVLDPRDVEEFPAELEGRPFEDVVDETRQLVDRAG